MTVNEYLKETQRPDDNGFQVRPRVTCADGYEISIQAGKGMYSTPRDVASYYTHVELGFPNIFDDSISKYAEDHKVKTKTVFPYVPVGEVDALLEKHGGIVRWGYSWC